MLRMGMTIGAKASTRLSTPAANQVVQPLLEAPETMNDLSNVSQCFSADAARAYLTRGISRVSVNS